MQTIESHIVTLYERGDISLIEVMNLIDFDNAKIIKTSLESDAILEQAELKPIKQKLEKSGNKDISYFDIKLTLAMIQK